MTHNARRIPCRWVREEMAKISNISLVTLTDRMKKGLPSYKQGASVYFIREEVFDYMKRHNATKKNVN